MASLQTILTLHKDAGQPMNLVTTMGTFADVTITDDGSVGDSIIITQRGGGTTIIPKSCIGPMSTTART